MSCPVRPAHLLATALLVILLAAGCVSDQQGSPSAQGNASPSAPLVFYTEENPPYSYQENGTPSGLAVDLLEAITARTGSPVTRDEVRLVPWSEGYRAALETENTSVFLTARLPSRESLFRWAGPVGSDRNVLLARRDAGISIGSPANLAGYRIGVVSDDAGVRQLLDLGVSESQLVSGGNASVLARMLENGEIDLWSFREAGGRHLLAQQAGTDASFVTAYSLEEFELYYAFNRNTSDAAVASFQAALDGLKDERDAANITSFDRIRGRHLPAVGLEQLEYLAEEWAPFNTLENGTASGLSVEVLEAVWREIGVNLTRRDVRVVPLADALSQARNATGTVVFSIARTPERDPLFHWAGPFAASTFVLWAPTAKNVTIASDADLERYRIGAVEASVENDLLAARGVDPSRIVHGETPEDLLAKLEGGEIDLWATGDLAGRHQVLKSASDPGAYEPVFTLADDDLYFVFGRDVPDALVAAFKRALERVQNAKDARGVSAYEEIAYRNLGVGCARPAYADQEVTDLVDATATSIEADAAGTLRRINAGEAPFQDTEHADLYAFVYDTNLTMVAHPNAHLVGASLRGKTDVAGTPFRDEILAGALANGTGWEEYVYTQPGRMNLYHKATYYRLATGSDGAIYVVCAGTYRPCA